MATMQLEKIFLGVTPNDQRKYVTSLFSYLKIKHPKIILPACGQFSLIKCAIEAGYEKKNIFASDISLFSSVLGYYYTRKDLSTINFNVKEPYKAEYEALENETDRIAFILWLMKTQQLNKAVYYEKKILENLFEEKEKHINKFRETMSNLRTYYKGINYDIKDLRAEINGKYGEDTLMVINPPAFKRGYQKMFAFDDVLEFNIEIEEFDLKKEYIELYNETKKKDFLTIWYRNQEVSQFNQKEVIFGKEYDVAKVDYWLITKPNAIKGFKYKNIISFGTEKILKRYKNSLIFGEDDEIKEDSKIEFISVDQVTALYYRDLWCHKLGNTKAEHYFLILIDKKVFATVGFHTSELFKLRSTRVFENYGFTAYSKRYPRINRLMMYLITCKEMGVVLRRSVSGVNRIYDLKGLKTTCLSKYRKVKLNNGVLTITKKEKMPDGVYKIMYETDWHDRSFLDCVKLFLIENKKNEN